MKASIEHDKATSTVHFRAGNINFIYGVPDRIQYIKEISDYDSGFITMQTNYGEEYTDLVELLEQSIVTKAFKNKAELILKELNLADITLKRS